MERGGSEGKKGGGRARDRMNGGTRITSGRERQKGAAGEINDEGRTVLLLLLL